MSLLQSGTRAAVLLALLLASAGSLAAPRTPADRARQLLEEAEFDEALKTINGALAKPDNTEAQLATLYELQGTTYLYLGREDKAREAFGKLLQAAPEYELPRGTSPKIRNLFDSVRADARRKQAAPPVRVVHEPPGRIVAGEPLDFEAEIIDAPESARARLFYRRAGAERFSSAFFSAADGGQYTARIPAFELPAQASAYTLEYYVEVADETGRRLGGVGSALEPGSLKIPAAQAATAEPPEIAEESWYQKWWVWAIAGGVAAGATAAIVIPMMDDKPATLPVTVRVQQ